MSGEQFFPHQSADLQKLQQLQVQSKQQQRFCKDCDYRGTGDTYSWESWRCKSPLNIYTKSDGSMLELNPVNGEPYRKVTYCKAARESAEFCGKEGKWFKAYPNLPARLTEIGAPIKAKSIGLEDL